MDLNILNAIRPGDKLDLHFINKQNMDYILSTSVYDIISEDEILIHNPLKDGKLYLIPMDVEVTVISKRKEYGVIAFRLQLLNRFKLGNIYAIGCKVISDLSKQQRRYFFRVNLYRDIIIRYLVDENQKLVTQYVFDPDVLPVKEFELKVSTLDISGGGLGFRSKTPFDLGTYIYLKLDFFDLRSEIHGVVVRCFNSTKYDNEYEIGIAFENLPSGVTRKITSFVFSSQQKARRKENDWCLKLKFLLLTTQLLCGKS